MFLVPICCFLLVSLHVKSQAGFTNILHSTCPSTCLTWICVHSFAQIMYMNGEIYSAYLQLHESWAHSPCRVFVDVIVSVKIYSSIVYISMLCDTCGWSVSLALFSFHSLSNFDLVSFCFSFTWKFLLHGPSHCQVHYDRFYGYQIFCFVLDILYNNLVKLLIWTFCHSMLWTYR